jgi:protein PhnA
MQAVLLERSQEQCELCQSTNSLSAYLLPESPDTTANSQVVVCAKCAENIETGKPTDMQHMRCLSNSMWSQVPAVQVLSYRLLNHCLTESWAQDALDMLYLDEEHLQWAKAGLVAEREPTLDANGVLLQAGDAVTIIKDLDVKGANFTAKRGTPVRNIGLSENPLHIEGRVNGQRIVIIAAYTKKN